MLKDIEEEKKHNEIIRMSIDIGCISKKEREQDIILNTSCPLKDEINCICLDNNNL